MKKRFILLLACIMEISALCAQETQFWGNVDRYQQRQGSHFLKQIDEALDQFRPDVSNNIMRRQALYNMDAILHNTFYDKSEELKEFMATRVEKVIADLRTPMDDSMKIYKLYNHGFIARAGGVSVAFDIISAGGMISDEQLELLVDQCDMMCISHKHPDHAEAKVANLFLSKGKKVYAPDEALPKIEGITRRYKGTGGDLTTEKLSFKGGDVMLNILHGHQDDLQNNLYVVTLPGGYTVCQSGDQDNVDDVAWLKTAFQRIPQVDVFMIICWNQQLQDTIDGFNPKLVVSGHENEILYHGIDHREAYWLSYEKFDAIRQPYCLMTWGEWISVWH